MADEEVEAIVAISEIMSKISDSAMKSRILNWAIQKFGGTDSVISQPISTTIPLPKISQGIGQEPQPRELPGIAVLEEDGKITFTIRDIKTKTASEAGIRLTLAAICAYKMLTGKTEASSKDVVVPLLKNWRIYDGNIRKAIRDHRGILRVGDALRLDSHAEADAAKILEEIVNPAVIGVWTPDQVGKRTKKIKKTEANT